MGAVILCSGGFGADFSPNSLLGKYRPDLMHLPTTNGEHCTGDGIKMGEAIGGKTIDLEWFQVHPTGLVKPDDPDAKIKFLAAEALRGVGGLVLDVDWLVDKFNLDLSLVARLGGHSAPRTHRGKECFPGMTITYALIQMVEKVAERTDKARIITKARATKLLTNKDGACVGLT